MGRQAREKDAKRAARVLVESVFHGDAQGWKFKAFDVLTLRGFWGRLKWLVTGR